MLINLLSGPRNLSTALMYSFAQRTDTVVVDEPYYASYLHRTGLPHPGREQVMASQPIDAAAVTHKLLHRTGNPYLFVKHMTQHLEGIDFSFLTQGRNVLLIRHPARIIRSYAKVIDNPTLQDLGIPMEHELYDYLTSQNALHAIVDADRLLADPRQVLEKLCLRLSIPWQEAMLHWTPGPRPEDGVWAPYWYGTVHRSTGFQPPEQGEPTVEERHRPLLDQALPLYQSLLSKDLLL